MLVLGIESTCDETACAVVRDGVEVLGHCLASQIAAHQPFHGVFPELAARRHAEAWPSLLTQTLAASGVTKSDLDLIAVAQGPGLMGSLLVGLHGGKALAYSLDLPWIGVNHVEAHLYAAMMTSHPELPRFPALGLVASGGHTFLVRIEEMGSYQMIGTTVDDAIGEAFDKVARLLDLPYPGGPAIEALALEGDPSRYPFRAGKVKEDPWNFSYSGIKTQVLYAVKGMQGGKTTSSPISPSEYPHIAASFQETVFHDLVERCVRAHQAYPSEALYLGGGVAQNRRLQALLAAADLPIPIYYPPPHLCSDNGVMIAGLGYWKYQQQLASDPWDAAPLPRMSSMCGN